MTAYVYIRFSYGNWTAKSQRSHRSRVPRSATHTCAEHGGRAFLLLPSVAVSPPHCDCHVAHDGGRPRWSLPEQCPSPLICIRAELAAPALGHHWTLHCALDGAAVLLRTQCEAEVQAHAARRASRNSALDSDFGCRKRLCIALRQLQQNLWDDRRRHRSLVLAVREQHRDSDRG